MKLFFVGADYDLESRLVGGDDFILYGLGEQVGGWWGGFNSLVCWTYFSRDCAHRTFLSSGNVINVLF